VNNRSSKEDMIRLLVSMVLLLLLPATVLPDARVETAGSRQGAVRLWVYKKWIGASGREGSVEIHLACPGRDDFEPRFINRDQPDGWVLSDFPADGLFCNVSELARDTFVADEKDCQNLLVVPGQDVECTMVNTKVVKRIDMLNRYGLGLMIVVMMTAGLLSVRKSGRF